MPDHTGRYPPGHNPIIPAKTMILKLCLNFLRPQLRIGMLDCVQREVLAGHGQ